MDIYWTPNKIASLNIIQKISKLPFEVGVLLGLYNNGYTVIGFKPDTIYSTRISYASLLTLIGKRDVKIVFIHNHPTIPFEFNSFPSAPDTYSTFILKKLCKLLRITFFDSVIVSRNKEYFSYRENNAFIQV